MYTPHQWRQIQAYAMSQDLPTLDVVAGLESGALALHTTPVLVPQIGKIAPRAASLGLSLIQVARQIGVSRGIVGTWDRGESEPDIWQLQSLATLLEVEFDALKVVLWAPRVKRKAAHGRGTGKFQREIMSKNGRLGWRVANKRVRRELGK